MTTDIALLSAVIGDVYDAAVDPSLWPRSLERCCSFVGGHSAVLYRHDAATKNSAALHIWNDDPHYTQLYFEKYISLNPVFPAATCIEAGLVYTPTDLVSKAEFVRTQFYKEWLAPQGIVDVAAVTLEKSATGSSVLDIRRNWTHGSVDESARSRLALLVPHLQRAVSVGRLFDQSRTQQAQLRRTLDHTEGAVFLVRSEGQIALANAQGRLMLDNRDLMSDRHGTLTAIQPEANTRLHSLIGAIACDDHRPSGVTSAVLLSSGAQQRWYAHVLPLTAGQRRQVGARRGAAAAVFVRKDAATNAAPLEALAQQFHLTASEVRVLDALLKANGVKAVATLLGVSQATVKTHLHNLFTKTGTTGQSELVKLVAGYKTR